jgi:DNA-binding NarL/FixJ family response regulator
MRLTTRQREIVACLGAEPRLSYGAVARRLGISPRTVKVHVEKIAVQLDSDYPAKVAVTMYAQTVPPEAPDRLSAVLQRMRPLVP